MNKLKMTLPILHFTVKRYKSGEWVAQCKEISGVLTGGMGKINREMIYEATLCALGYGVHIGKEKKMKI